MQTNHLMSATLIRQCLACQVIPLVLTEHALEIASVDVITPQVEAILRFVCNKPITCHLWPPAKFVEQFQKLKQKQESENTPSDDTISTFVNALIVDALQQRASDIHIEPYSTYYRIRLRIDGLLKTYPSVLMCPPAQISARLKIIAGLDIANHRSPQDGQLSVRCVNETHALRISTLPTLYGEKIVLRVQASPQGQLSVSELGMPTNKQNMFTHNLKRSQGLILVTGPTGSGKTATLYSGLSAINDGKRNICSVEDPVEIPLEGINQSQVNTKSGLTFSTVLRALLRQDPDVIMIGEIRDKETAEIAIESAQTGHLVLSTLHTNSTAESIVRLKQMGIPNYLLASSLTLIIAQRLLRKLCVHCKTQSSPYYDDRLPTSPIATWQATGCEHCVGGYYHRTGIYEMLSVSAMIKQALLTDCSVDTLQRIACNEGMQTLFEQALLLAQRGITSISEIYRVLDPPASHLDER